MRDNSFVIYITDLLSDYGTIRARAMFGGYGIYCNDIIFAIIVENELYFKADKDLAESFAKHGSTPFTYEAKGKKVSMSYWNVSIDIIEDEALLKNWFDQSMIVSRGEK